MTKLENGYYLSVYGMIDQLAYLSKNYVRHDFAIALWLKRNHNISLIRYVELERLTGQKTHDQAFFNKEHFEQVVQKILNEFNLKFADIKKIWGLPEYSDCSEYYSMDRYGKFSYHALGHLFSALLMETDIFWKQNILVFSVDGGPDNLIDSNFYKKYFYAGAYAKKGEIIEVFPVYSPGGIWDIVSKYYNLREGTLMALATASKSELKKQWIDPVLILDMKSAIEAEEKMKKLIDYVESDDLSAESYNFMDDRFSISENKISMVMKIVQKFSLDIMTKNVETAIQRFNIQPTDTCLAMSGGFGLNCPCNSYLMERYSFKGFLAPPCINDSGMALGIGLYAFYMHDPNMKFSLKHSYYGNCDNKISEALNKYKDYIKTVNNFSIDRIIQDIINDPIVWFDSASEIGPRALGHRSLLADPQSMKAKDKLNEIKQRQWWRPVAPIVAEEMSNDWFESSYESPYMLHTFYVKKEKQEQVPAILHLDNSARIQTINSMQNLKLYKIIMAFYKKTDIPIICNTSLNDRGEPIIDNIDQLFNFALRKNISIVYINGNRFELTNHETFKETKPSIRPMCFEQYLTESEKENHIKQLNPHNCSNDLIRYYIRNQPLRNKYDIKNKLDVHKLKMMYQLNNRGELK